MNPIKQRYNETWRAAQKDLESARAQPSIVNARRKISHAMDKVSVFFDLVDSSDANSGSSKTYMAKAGKLVMSIQDNRENAELEFQVGLKI